MRDSSARSSRVALCLAIAISSVSCGSVCGLGLHDRISPIGSVTCCGGFVVKDLALMGKAGDAEFDLANTAMPSQPGLVDAYLVPTSCEKLFDGSYPGSPPLCTVYLGPATPGKVAPRAKLKPGTYRLWVQGYTANQGDTPFLIDVDIWDYRCGSPIQ